MELNREQALVLLQKYNKEPFHIQHALTVEGVMGWFAAEAGEDVTFWSLCGLLHVRRNPEFGPYQTAAVGSKGVSLRRLLCHCAR